jgi:hypothetical protein
VQRCNAKVRVGSKKFALLYHGPNIARGSCGVDGFASLTAKTSSISVREIFSASRSRKNADAGARLRLPSVPYETSVINARKNN